MSIDIQTLNDALIAIVATVGVAVAFTIAFIAIGAFVQRDKSQARTANAGKVGPAQHPTQTDDARELVLR